MKHCKLLIAGVVLSFLTGSALASDSGCSGQADALKRAECFVAQDLVKQTEVKKLTDEVLAQATSMKDDPKAKEMLDLVLSQAGKPAQESAQKLLDRIKAPLASGAVQSKLETGLELAGSVLATATSIFTLNVPGIIGNFKGVVTGLFSLFKKEPAKDPVTGQVFEKLVTKPGVTAEQVDLAFKAASTSWESQVAAMNLLKRHFGDVYTYYQKALMLYDIKKKAQLQIQARSAALSDPNISNLLVELRKGRVQAIQAGDSELCQRYQSQLEGVEKSVSAFKEISDAFNDQQDLDQGQEICRKVSNAWLDLVSFQDVIDKSPKQIVDAADVALTSFMDESIRTDNENKENRTNAKKTHESQMVMLKAVLRSGLGEIDAVERFRTGCIGPQSTVCRNLAWRFWDGSARSVDSDCSERSQHQCAQLQATGKSEYKGCMESTLKQCGSNITQGCSVDECDTVFAHTTLFGPVKEEYSKKLESYNNSRKIFVRKYASEINTIYRRKGENNKGDAIASWISSIESTKNDLEETVKNGRKQFTADGFDLTCPRRF